MKIMNIYAQERCHDSVRIAGTPDALRALRDAIGEAIEGVNGRGRAKCFASDGGGYVIEITQFTDELVLDMPVPYTGGGK